jgi:hypothetical protein
MAMQEAAIFIQTPPGRRQYAQAYDPAIHAFRIREYLEECEGDTSEIRAELAEQLGISESSVYRFETTKKGEDRRNTRHLEIAAAFFSKKLKRTIALADLIS